MSPGGLGSTGSRLKPAAARIGRPTRPALFRPCRASTADGRSRWNYESARSKGTQTASAIKSLFIENYYTAFLVHVWKLNAAQVLCLACLGVVMGNWLKRRLPILDRLNIPAPIAGGMVYALLELGLRDRYLNFEADVVLRDLLMVTFMTTVGLSARLRLIREGGRGVVWLLAIASAGAVIQNLLGIGLALALHVDPRLGILTGSVALTGGPATALAFGPVFEKMGVQGATAAAFAAATFGIMAAGLIAGYIGGSQAARAGRGRSGRCSRSWGFPAPRPPRLPPPPAASWWRD